MLKDIVLWPNKKLYQISENVDINDPTLPSLIEDLFDTMYWHNGIGLSAIQIGIPKRVFVLDVGVGEKMGQEVYINPKIVRYIEKPTKMNEGCLSVPGTFALVDRCPIIEFEWINLDGTKTKKRTDLMMGNQIICELRAQAMQHELAHLQGQIFIDNQPKIMKDIAKSRIKKLRKSIK